MRILSELTAENSKKNFYQFLIPGKKTAVASKSLIQEIKKMQAMSFSFVKFVIGKEKS